MPEQFQAVENKTIQIAGPSISKARHDAKRIDNKKKA